MTTSSMGIGEMIAMILGSLWCIYALWFIIFLRKEINARRRSMKGNINQTTNPAEHAY